MRVLVVGVGGLGGRIGGELAGAHEVLAYTRNPEVRHALEEHGYRLTGVGGERTVAATVLDELPSAGDVDLVVLATQPPQMVGAAQSIVHLLRDDSRVLAIQNGLPGHHLRPIVGDRVVSCVVGFGASMPEPGRFERTSEGAFTLDADPSVDDIAALLEPIASVKRTDNLLGARWSKLAFNCVISTLGTIGGDTLGALIQRRLVRQLALEVFTEVVAVADAEGVKLEKLAGAMDLRWVTVDERTSLPARAAKHALLLAVGARYRRLRSSMLAALERGREPAVDFLNGEIVEAGERHGVPTPVNRAAQEMVHAIHRGEQRSSIAAIEALYAQTR